MSSFCVIVKAPNQKTTDQSVDCGLDWDVLTLKKHLSIVYPTKPRVEDQRLIFSGHLLRNEQILRDVLQPNDDNITLTVHLVCSQPSQDSPRHTNNNNNMDNNNSERSSTNSNTSQPQTDASRNANGNTTPVRGTPNVIQPLFQYGYTQPVTGPMVLTHEQMFQQMAMMQQAYAQYMAQYFGQMPMVNAQIGQPQVNFTPNVTIPPQQIPVTGVPAPENAPPNVPPPQPQQGPQVQRMNAGPGGAAMEDDDELNNRDWLDWFYYMSRAIVLFSIVYFYSSFSRFVFVVALALLLYVYQMGWFTRRNGQRQNIPPVVPVPVVPAPVHDNNRNNRNVDNDVPNLIDHQDVPAEESEGTQIQNVNSLTPATEERFTGLRLFWVIVSSLFTSLIPEQPAPVNLN